MESGPKDPPAQPQGQPQGQPHRDRPRASRRWGLATSAYVVVVLALLVAVNLIGSRIPTVWDVTQSHDLTLSKASKQVLAKLTKPVKVYAFEVPGDTIGVKVEVLLHQYAADSHGRLTYQVVDPQADPALAQAYGVTTAGTVVVVSGHNRQTLLESDLVTYDNAGNQQFDGEAAITNAIIRAASPVQFTVDFVTGDGEPDISQGRLPGAVQALKDRGYKVGTLSLISGAGVPANVAAVIIAHPQNDLAPAAITALQNYTAAGGHVMVLLDPLTKTLPRLDALLASWGVTPQNDLVVDTGPNNHYQTSALDLIPNYGSSPITNPLSTANLPSVLPGVQGFTLGKPKGYTLTPILTTSGGTVSGSANTKSPTSWGVTNLATLAQNGTANLQYNPKVDIAGPLTIGVTVASAAGQGASSASGAPQAASKTAGSKTAKTAASATSATGSSSTSATSSGTASTIGVKQFRAVIIGNSTFISSSGQISAIDYFPGNKDLFLNSVGWLTGRSQGIALTPPSSLNTSVTLTGGQSRLLTDTFLIGIPLICFLLAFSTWWSRRKL